MAEEDMRLLVSYVISLQLLSVVSLALLRNYPDEEAGSKSSL